MEPLQDATTVEHMLLTQAKQTRTPANGSIELLPLCNMNCDMCYVRLSREEMERQGRLRTADEWLEIGRQMKDAGVLFLLLTGGEPFLYPDFKRLYLGLRQMGMILTINTNGTLIDEDLAEFFGKYKPQLVHTLDQFKIASCLPFSLFLMSSLYSSDLRSVLPVVLLLVHRSDPF